MGFPALFSGQAFLKFNLQHLTALDLKNLEITHHVGSLGRIQYILQNKPSRNLLLLFLRNLTPKQFNQTKKIKKKLLSSSTLSLKPVLWKNFPKLENSSVLKINSICILLLL